MSRSNHRAGYASGACLLLLVALLSGGPALTAGSETRWHPLRWKPCDRIVVPWRSSLQTTMSALRRSGIMGVQRRGDVRRGTMALMFRDEGRSEAIELVFDTAGVFIGAATEHRTSSIANTQAFVANTVGRLVVDGGRILRRTSSSADVRLSCNGLELTLTIGIADDRPLVAFVSVMVEHMHAAMQAD